jgi:hypothetical protein
MLHSGSRAIAHRHQLSKAWKCHFGRHLGGYPQLLETKNVANDSRIQDKVEMLCKKGTRLLYSLGYCRNFSAQHPSKLQLGPLRGHKQSLAWSYASSSSDAEHFPTMLNSEARKTPQRLPLLVSDAKHNGYDSRPLPVRASKKLVSYER